MKNEFTPNEVREKRVKTPLKSNGRRRLCMFLALLMILGTAAVPVLPVAATVQNDAATQSRIDQVKEILNAASYDVYLKDNSDLYVSEHNQMPMGSGEIVIKPGDINSDPALTTAQGVKTADQLGKSALYLPDSGAVSFNFTVAKEGLYNLAITYLQVVGKTSAIERMLRIDGKVPFKEARYITMTKTYVDDYVYADDTDLDSNGNPKLKPASEITDFASRNLTPQFKKDIKDNDIRVTKSEAPEWKTIITEDSSGFVEEPFLYYLTAGEHVLTLEAVRESVYINEMKFYIANPIPTYDEYMAAHSTAKDGTADIPVMEAEKPAATSEIVIYGVNDRSSAITTPQDVSRIRLNSIGGTRWQNYGEWIRYDFEVPAGGEGFYYIVPRFKQSVNSGVYSSRKVKIDGEVPFQEASRLRFNFGDGWQVEPLNDGTKIPDPNNSKKQTTQHFEFYLTEGKHTIEFEVALGDMAQLLGDVEISVNNLNDMYRKIRMITGATPDNYRDYGFGKQIPAVLEGMLDESIKLRNISALFKKITGNMGEQTVMLEKMALQLDRMARNTDRIAPGMDTFKANIGGLAQWLLDRRNQPLDLDYIKIQRIGDKLPTAEANIFQAAGFEFSSFLMSFFADYNSQGAMEPITDKTKVVEVWMGSSAPVMGGLALAGRDQAQVVRQMVVDFTQQTGIQVNLKLVAGGSLLPSVLAGVGPDVALANNGGDAINYAIRSAVQPLNYIHTKNSDGSFNIAATDYTKGDPSRGILSFDEVTKFFNPSALVPLTLQNDAIADKSQLQVFGLPETQTFPMLFYRKDILAQLNVDVPKTWDDLYKIVPILQTKNMDVGIAPGTLPLYTFMYQQNVPLYKGDGIEINLDDNYALDSFKRMTNLYTLYKFPVDFNFANRFRLGDMPVSVQYYDAYNQLMVFAPEIRGLWEFVPMPGTIRKYDPVKDAGIQYEKYTGYTDANGEVEDGWIIDPTSPAGVVTTLMMRSAKAKNNMENAWAFMQWWVGAKAQGRFGSELVALMGPAAKYPTANLEALANMPWPSSDYKNLSAQFKYLKAIPEVPGSYIVGRYVDFTWKAVYNDGKSAIDLMQDYNIEINKELTRKRSEFGMPVIKVDRQGRRLDKLAENQTTTEAAK